MAQKKKISDKTDKRRRAKVVVGHDQDGDPIVKYASGRTQKELDENIEELKRTYITGIATQRDALFGVYAMEWYETYKEPKLSASTRAHYATAFNKHILPVFGDRQMRAIRAIELQRFLNGKRGMGKTSVGDIYNIIKNVFATATAQGVIDRNPALSLTLPETERNSRRALTEAETKAVLSVAATHQDGLLLLLLYYTGLRRGEVLGLQWRDIDLTNRVLHVRRDMDFATGQLGELKTKAAYRDVPIPENLAIALDKVRGIGATPVIRSPRKHGHWSQSTFVRHWCAIAIDLYNAAPTIEHEQVLEQINTDGVTVPIMGSILTPHYFRHNYASILYNAGVDVLSAKAWLGHSDVKTTLSIYAHLGKLQEKHATEKLESAFK